MNEPLNFTTPEEKARLDQLGFRRVAGPNGFQTWDDRFEHPVSIYRLAKDPNDRWRISWGNFGAMRWLGEGSFDYALGYLAGADQRFRQR